jgi:hypothetical protein
MKEIAMVVIIMMRMWTTSCVTSRTGADRLRNLASLSNVERINYWTFSSGSWDDYSISAELLLKNGKYLMLDYIDVEDKKSNRLVFKYIFYIDDINLEYFDSTEHSSEMVDHKRYVPFVDSYFRDLGSLVSD